MQTECDNCGSTDFVETNEVGSTGVGGPDFLPGTGLLDHARFTLQICAQCGKVYWWVLGDDLRKVKKSPNFKRVDHGN